MTQKKQEILLTKEKITVIKQILKQLFLKMN